MICVYIYIYICIHTYVYIYIYMYHYMYIYVYIYIYMLLYIYIYIVRERHAYIYIERERDVEILPLCVEGWGGAVKLGEVRHLRQRGSGLASKGRQLLSLLLVILLLLLLLLSRQARHGMGREGAGKREKAREGKGRQGKAREGEARTADVCGTNASCRTWDVSLLIFLAFGNSHDMICRQIKLNPDAHRVLLNDPKPTRACHCPSRKQGQKAHQDRGIKPNQGSRKGSLPLQRQKSHLTRGSGGRQGQRQHRSSMNTMNIIISMSIAFVLL